MADIPPNAPFKNVVILFAGQQPVLHRDVEEEHSDILASYPLQGGGRAWYPTQAGPIGDWPWPDDAERYVAHGRHRQASQTALEGSKECWVARKGDP